MQHAVKTVEEVIEKLAKQRVARYFGGYTDTHVATSMVAFIYEDPLIAEKVDHRYRELISKHFEDAKEKNCGY